MVVWPSLPGYSNTLASRMQHQDPPSVCSPISCAERCRPRASIKRDAHALAGTGLLPATAHGLSEMMMPCMPPAAPAMGCHQSGISRPGGSPFEGLCRNTLYSRYWFVRAAEMIRQTSSTAAVHHRASRWPGAIARCGIVHVTQVVSVLLPLCTAVSTGGGGLASVGTR